MTLKEKIIQAISEVTGLPKEEISLTIPEYPEFGHYSTNVAFRIAKKEGRPFDETARKYAGLIWEKLKEIHEGLSLMGNKVDDKGLEDGFINFRLKPGAIQKEFARVYKNRKTFGSLRAGKGKKVIVEYSQPNIAKQMHVGHLRTTIIGDALARVHKAVGYKVIRWNYLGDWGTQFGNLIAAYKKWGNEKELENNPLQTLE